MTTTTSHPWDTSRTDETLRVGTAERERAVSMLQDAFSEGRIDKTELDQRIESALAARTRADLAVALRGLPLGSTSQAGVPQQRPASSDAVASLDRSWGMVAHWLGVVSSFVGPGIVAATKGRTSPYIRKQAMEAVNFQVTVIAAWIAIGIVTGVTFGVASFLFPMLGVVSFALAGIAGLAAATGSGFRYPCTLRLFR